MKLAFLIVVLCFASLVFAGKKTKIMEYKCPLCPYVLPVAENSKGQHYCEGGHGGKKAHPRKLMEKIGERIVEK